MKQLKRYGLGLGAFLLLLVEIWLRVAFGLGHPALLQADPYTGYRYQPNQDLVRFGKRIVYNQYSQRSEPITSTKPADRLRVLMVGDSVLNGGNPTDQSQTITELFEQQLIANGHAAEVLNASAGSWGPGNELAYLQHFGTFNSDVVILEVGANDLVQPTSGSDRVGKDPNFPDRNPGSAIQEGIGRYILPGIQRFFRLTPLSEIPLAEHPARQFERNQRSFAAIAALVRERQLPFFVVFVPRYYNVIPRLAGPEFKSEFLRQLAALKIPVIDAQTAWAKLPFQTVHSYFRDSDHLTAAGNEAVAALLYQNLCLEKQLRACVSRN